MTVTVVHPQVQHSHQVARALAEAGLLEQYVTSCCFTPQQIALLSASLRTEFSKRYHPHIPYDRVATFPYAELAWKLAGMIVSPALHERLFYHNVWLFDRMVSRRVARSQARIVVGYENSSRATFRAAKRQGKFCVLDAASVHYQAQQEVYTPPYSAAFLKRINAGKAEEIRLADHILTLSGYARETYIRAGVPAGKISVIPLGVDCSRFHGSSRNPAPEGFRFLFVGNIKYSKGTDLLLKSFERLDIPGKQLVIIGASGDASHLLSPLPEGVTVKGHMPHDQLCGEYDRADVFVLPSRLDGFGLVVTEAMATGTPVIVSSHVGAKDLVQNGVTGWIFESGDLDSLAACMLQAYEQKRDLPTMGARALETVSACTWEQYRATVGRFYAELSEKLP